MKKFCKDLREQATKIINYEKKKMTPLTTKEKIHYNEHARKNLIRVIKKL